MTNCRWMPWDWKLFELRSMSLWLSVGTFPLKARSIKKVRQIAANQTYKWLVELRPWETLETELGPEIVSSLKKTAETTTSKYNQQLINNQAVRLGQEYLGILNILIVVISRASSTRQVWSDEDPRIWTRWSTISGSRLSIILQTYKG